MATAICCFMASHHAVCCHLPLTLLSLRLSEFIVGATTTEDLFPSFFLYTGHFSNTTQGPSSLMGPLLFKVKLYLHLHYQFDLITHQVTSLGATQTVQCVHLPFPYVLS